MPFLPIAERELRVAARKTATYRTRFWAVLFALVAFAWQLLALMRDNRPATVHGSRLFTTLSVVAFFYSLFIGTRTTADCLSEEKREGTLGLLFLTDLKGYDIVFGKLVASSVNAFYGLIAIVPMLAICLLLGGVAFAQFWKTILVLVTVLFFSLAAGIFVSIYNRDERKAMFFTTFVILLATFGPLLLAFLVNSGMGASDSDLWPIMALSPAFPFFLSIESGASGLFPGAAFWSSLAFTWMITIFFLFRSCQKVPSSWQEKGQRIRASKLISFKLPQPDRVQNKKFRAHALEINPFLWLTLRGREKLNHAWGFVIAVILIWTFGFLRARNVMWDYELLFPTILFIHAFLKIWITSEACTRLVEDRRSGALELLLSTPLSEKQIIRGQLQALTRQFGGPLLLLISLELFVFLLGVIPGQRAKFFLLTASILLATDFFTLRWVAMWVGLNSRNVNRAVLRTALLVLALPWILYTLLKTFLPIFEPVQWSEARDQMKWIVPWLTIALFTNLILYLWAKPKLLRQFRLLATQPVRATK